MLGVVSVVEELWSCRSGFEITNEDEVAQADLNMLPNGAVRFQVLMKCSCS